ncbi:MAG: YeeE/YedE family protein [Nannocystaceae bacterium]
MVLVPSELLAAAIGGLLIGIASLGLLLASGRVVGISGILGGLLPPRRGDSNWRWSFVGGLLAGGLLLQLVWPQTLEFSPQGSTTSLLAAGLLVGAGTRIGNGCTSGHGVCGISRLSKRSFIATTTFMAAAIATVYFTRHILAA